MNNSVKISQLALLLMLVMTGGKFLSLPALLAKDVGHDSWLVVSINFALDFVCLCLVLWALRLNRFNLGLDNVLSVTLSPVVSTLVMVVFFAMFVVRATILMESCYKTFSVIFDVNTNWVLFVLPILLLSAFALARGFTSVARAAQILFVPVVLSIAAITIYPVTITNFSALLPFAEAGGTKLMQTAFLRCFWFSDYIFVYFVMEQIKPQKSVFLPIVTSFVAGAAITVLLNAVFLCLYGTFAQHNEVLMIKIGIFSLSATTDGRWDWITLTIWIMSVFIKTAIFLFCAYKCVEKILRKHFAKTNWRAVAFVGMLLMLPMFVSMHQLTQRFALWFAIPFALLQYLLPPLLPLLTKVANNRMANKMEAVNG